MRTCAPLVLLGLCPKLKYPPLCGGIFIVVPGTFSPWAAAPRRPSFRPFYPLGSERRNKMFNRKSIYALNKKDPDAIVYMDTNEVIVRLTREDFASEE